MERIVLAYSGGLDTSVAIPWLKEKYQAEIIAVTMDLGQGKELEEVRDRALATGAVRAHVLDLRDEFARDYILPALKADAIYEDRYPMATALGRPLIGQKLVEIAEIEQATAIAHGCTGKGNDQVRLDVTTRALNPKLKVIAPARDWGMTRPEEIEYARQRHVPVPATVASPYSTDSNLWGRSIECGCLEDPWQEPPEDIYTLTKAPADCPDEPAYVELAFERGVPSAINGVQMPWLDLIASLGTIAGAHGGSRLHRDLGAAGGNRRAESARRDEAVHDCGGQGLMSTLWSGRFETPPDAEPFEFGASFRFDRRLFDDDVTGSVAWARALATAGVLSRDEARQIEQALADILAHGRSNPAFVDGPDEDVHSFVERVLIERVGDAGRR